MQAYSELIDQNGARVFILTVLRDTLSNETCENITPCQFPLGVLALKLHLHNIILFFYSRPCDQRRQQVMTAMEASM